MAVTRFKLMLNILESLRTLYFSESSQYSRYIVSRCSSDMGGGGLNDGFMGKGYNRSMIMSSFVICTETKKRTQLLYYLAIVGVKHTYICILCLQEIVYRMRGHYPVRSLYLGNHRKLEGPLPQYPKLWVMTIQRDEELKK